MESPYLDVTGLLHEPPRILRSSVAFRELHSEELESPFEIRLQEVLFRRLERDMMRQGEKGGSGNEDRRETVIDSPQQTA